MRNSAVPFKSILILSALLLCFTVGARTRFIRVMFSGNTSKSATIIWDQQRGDFKGLYCDTINPELSQYKDAKPLTSSNTWKGMHTHCIRLRDLKANTKYFFIIKDSEGFGRLYHFYTAPNSSNDQVSFIAGGDSRDNRPVRTKANKLVPKLFATAVLFNGDFIGLDNEKQWIEWFADWEKTISIDGRVTPMIVTRGNHELSNKDLVKLFDVPNKKVYYSSTFSGDLLHIVSLNSEIHKFGRQKLFLKQALAKHADYHWQIAQYHRPVRAHVKSKKEMETQYKHFVPLFEQYANLPLCLENDSHTFKVTWPIVSSKDSSSAEGFKRDDINGIIYAGEGCWGAPLREADDAKIWTRDCGAVNQFNWIIVSKDKIQLRTVLYENEADVESLSYNNRFTIPKGLTFYGPKNGELIEIFPRNKEQFEQGRIKSNN
jgi:hypothetical protein